MRKKQVKNSKGYTPKPKQQSKTESDSDTHEWPKSEQDVLHIYGGSMICYFLIAVTVLVAFIVLCIQVALHFRTVQ
jgi:hypothetical protein